MEEHFKNKLKNHQVEWDKESLLVNLKEELNQDKNRFNRKWLLLLPVLLLATCWGWNFLQEPADQTTTILLENISDLYEKENNLVENTPVNKKEINIEKEEGTFSELHQLNRKDIELNKAKLKAKSGTESEDNLNSDRSITTSLPNEKLNIQKNLDFSKPKSQISKKLSAKNSNYPEIKVSEVPKEILKTQTVSEPVSKAASSINEVKKILMPLNYLSSLELKELELIKQKAYLPPIRIMDESERKDKAGIENPFYISGSGEVGIVYRNRIFNSDNSEFVNRLEQNEETEDPFLAITTNFNLGYQHKSGWSFQSGLEYNEIKEVFNYNKLSFDTLLMPKDEVLYFIVDNMDTLFVRDTSNVFRTEERIIKHFNKHTFYSIPFQVGYRFDLKKAKLVGRLGLNYTFTNNFKGKRNQVLEDGGSEIIENHPELKFQLKNRIGLYAGLTLEYPLMKQSQIFAIASYRCSPKLTIGVVEQKYHSLSFGVGIKISLRKSN